MIFGFISDHSEVANVVLNLCLSVAWRWPLSGRNM